MSLEDPDVDRLNGVFPVIEALSIDLTGGYERFSVSGLGQPPRPGPTGQLNPGEELEITLSAPPGRVSVATLEARNWPHICIEYVARFLGDLFTFGRALTYGAPPIDPANAVNRRIVFTLQADGVVRYRSLGGECVCDLKQCGATKFYITLRSMAGNPGVFSIQKTTKLRSKTVTKTKNGKTAKKAAKKVTKKKK